MQDVGCTEPKANCADPALDGAVRLRLSAPYAIGVGGQGVRVKVPSSGRRFRSNIAAALNLLRPYTKTPQSFQVRIR